ncbi:MAG: xanthine dehydrogenase family protein [Burkholderiales bacterium]|nr:xanthine dehydrogenase family protein [Burkholderiales bacterium]
MTNATSFARFGSGQSVNRMEDRALIEGRGCYTDDVTLDDQLHLVFLRSSYPHARIIAVDAAAARAMPGVALVVTGAELAAAGVKPLPGNPFLQRADGKPCASAPRRPLAHEVARFVGEAVAAVVATSVAAARAAAEAIVVEVEELPALPTMAAAMADGAPLLVADAPRNIAAEMRHGDAARTADAFAAAAHVVGLDIVNQRLAAVTMEPRSVLCNYDAGADRLTIRMSTQMPSGMRDTLCDAVLGIPKEKVRVIVGDVGGGFGMKTGIYPEDCVVAWAALKLKRNVKWIAERGEEFLATTHGRDIETRAELALDAGGRILGLRIRTLANMGAYTTPAGGAIQLMIGPWVQTSIYDIQTIDFHMTAVMTNQAPTGPYRGAGRPEAIHNMERLMDEAARVTGIDRVELRRRNMVRPQQMPYKNPMGQTYDSGQFEKVMDEALALADWAGFESRRAASAARGRWRGQGIATFLEWTGGNALEERVTVSVAADGMIEIFSAVQQMGQGIATSLRQLAVDIFGLPPERIRIVLGDTDRGVGFGSAGSRSIFTGGGAVKVASEKTIDRARELAAEALEVAAGDIEYAGGELRVVGTDRRIDLFALAARQPEKRIFIESSTAAAAPSWPNGCHVSEVEVDPATGQVRVVAYASVNDVGRVVNPTIVRGQLDGGALQGIGQALCEQVVYDAESAQALSASFMDYTMPKADMAPAFRTEMDTSTPCLTNILGVKGVGELGTIGATPSVVNAVADALARAGKSHLAPKVQMPITPARLWGLLQA